jgi:hypothetical protein
MMAEPEGAALYFDNISSSCRPIYTYDFHSFYWHNSKYADFGLPSARFLQNYFDLQREKESELLSKEARSPEYIIGHIVF